MIITYTKTKFILEAKEEIHLPDFKGSAFRGLFGNTFKKVVCVLKKNTCENCLLRKSCIYSYIFETHPFKEPIIAGREKYVSIPHPYIIEPPLENRRVYLQGEKINFHLILIGKASQYLPYFIYTFDEAGKVGVGKGRGRFCLKSVVTDVEEIYSSDTNTVKKTTDKMIKIYDDNLDKAYNEITNKLKLKLITPVRIKHDRKYIRDLPFYILIKTLLLRLDFLGYYHCDQDVPPLEVREKILKESEKIRIKSQEIRWWDWERYSTRQLTRMKLGGIIGEIEYEGEIKSYTNFLRAGELLHIGKNTSFGLGKYVILEQQ